MSVFVNSRNCGTLTPEKVFRVARIGTAKRILANYARPILDEEFKLAARLGNYPVKLYAVKLANGNYAWATTTASSETHPAKALVLYGSEITPITRRAYKVRKHKTHRIRHFGPEGPIAADLKRIDLIP